MELKLQNNSFNDNILRLINTSTETERFERKVPLKKGQSFFYKNKLIHKGFSELYEARHITSIYLDTHDYYFARQNINGEFLRVKPRIRFYNAEFQNAALELKFKKNYNNFKKIFKKKKIVKQTYSEVIKKYQLLASEVIGLKVFPSSIVNYQRQYYIYKNIRLTVDNNLYVKKFLNRRIDQNNLSQLNLDVIEFKYTKNLDSFFRRNFNYFFSESLRSNKCSKYVHSVTRVI